MENKIKRKINTFGKVTKILTMIVIVFLLVAEGFLLVGGVIAAVVPKDSITVDNGSDTRIDVDTNYFGLNGRQFFIKIGNTELYVGQLEKGEFDVKSENGNLTLTDNAQDKHYDLNAALMWIICEMTSFAAIIIALYFFRSLMKQFMVCDTPFSDCIVKKMRAFAIALIPCMVVYLASSAAKNSILGNDGGPGLILSVVFVLTIFVLTMIFKYGAELQKEHDDTV
jgi:hypothetical protein